MKQLQVSKTILIIVTLLTVISCTDKKIPYINIEKVEPIGWKIKEPCNIIYSDNNDSVVIPAKIKCRGGVSSRYYKHSFALELDNKYALGNLPSDDDWILNANYIDKTFMRHKISYDLFRQMNSKNIASKSTFINVKINNRYNGLYVLMEEVNASMIGLDKNDSLAMLFKDPPIFHKEILTYVQDSLNYYQQKYPKINIIDWHIILLFSNNSDGIMKNFYLYKLNSETPFRIAIWDYDHSFGRDGDNELNLMDRELNCNRSVLLARLSLISETGYLDKLKKRWYELRELNIISCENIEYHIDRNDKIIRNAINDNFDIWPIDSKWYYDKNNYEQEINLISDFVKLRINQLDEYFNSI